VGTVTPPRCAWGVTVDRIPYELVDGDAAQQVQATGLDLGDAEHIAQQLLQARARFDR
jgi:hypothetical protein